MRVGGGTIAAIATATGAGGVGIIRISGADAGRILASVTRSSSKSLVDRLLTYGHVYDQDTVVDEVLFVLMRGPRSFTGDDVAEIHGHGGAANLGALLRCVIDAGARHAEPGEFTRRAFENGRIDLTRAEAIADIVNASSSRALRVAQEQLAGKLGSVIEGLLAQVTDLEAQIEAGIDFPEDANSTEEIATQSALANDAAHHCERLMLSFGMGRVLRDGADVVLRGAVNVGKSSLFNTLVGRDRSIVTAEAGTTRDYVEAQVVWSGLQITLVDTAGLRLGSSSDEIEARGIEMGVARAERADLEILVVDSLESSLPDLGGTDIERVLIVRSKADLIEQGDRDVGERDVGERDVGEGEVGEGEGAIMGIAVEHVGIHNHTEAADASGVIATSSITGLGIEELKREVVRRVTGCAAESAEGCVVTNERQRSRLHAASDFLGRAAQLILSQSPAEVIVLELRSARSCLAEVIGREVGDDMLDSLFSKFCIGK